MCAAYLKYRKPIRMDVAWNVGNQFGCQFLGMGTNSDTASPYYCATDTNKPDNIIIAETH